jgi:hypothetical protein
MNDPLLIVQDVPSDLVYIEGIRYAGVVFRSMMLAEPGTWLRIEERRDGTITVYKPNDAVHRVFDTLVGRGVRG